MQIYGNRVCYVRAIGFDLALTAAFALHAVELSLFWSALGGFMILCSVTALGLRS